MAGLVGAWPDPEKAEDDPEKRRLSMAILTRDAHVAPGEVHGRKPACLTPDVYDDRRSPRAGGVHAAAGPVVESGRA